MLLPSTFTPLEIQFPKPIDVIADQFQIGSRVVRGVTYANGNLISCDDSTVYVHDGFSDTILSSFSAGAGFLRGLDIYNGNLISMDALSDLLYIHDGISSTVTSSFSVAGGGDIATDGQNLFVCANTDIIIYDGFSSTVLDTLDVSSVGRPLVGLVYDGVRLISSDESNKVHIHEGVSATIEYSFDKPSGPTGTNSTEGVTVALGSLISAIARLSDTPIQRTAYFFKYGQGDF